MLSVSLRGIDHFKKVWGTSYNKFNVPVWVHLNKHGDTIVRGLSPRINCPFLHVFLNTKPKDIQDMLFEAKMPAPCIELQAEDLEEMD